MIKKYLYQDAMFPVYTLYPPIPERAGGPIYNSEISEELFERYQKMMTEFHKVQSILQNMYNKKEGLA